MPNDYTCDGCGKPFTIRSWADRCTPHEDGCSGPPCDCDLNYHPECCPSCSTDWDESEDDA